MQAYLTVTRSAAATLVLLSGLLIAFGQGPVHSAEMPKKGVTPYVTHFIFILASYPAQHELGDQARVVDPGSRT